MKLPKEVIGINRKDYPEDMSAAVRPDGGRTLAPLDQMCEETCHEVHEIGSDEHEECLDDCRDSG